MLPPVIDPALDSATRRRLDAIFQQGWDDLASDVLFTRAEAPAQDHPKAIAFLEGPLQSGHAALLRRQTPVLLCARREEQQLPAAWEVKLALALMGGRVLGPSSVRWKKRTVGSLQELEEAAERMGALVAEAGGNSATSQIVIDVTHELLANALLDAPVDEAGQQKYAHRRDQAPELAAEDACRIAIGTAEGRIFISVSDRFGRLTEAPLVRAVEGLGRPAQLDTSGGGAGLGFRRLIEHSDALAIRVTPGRATEVMSVVELAGARRRSGSPKSVFFSRSSKGGPRVG